MSSDLKILLVTADSAVAEIINASAASHNSICETVSDAMEALDRIKEADYDLMFLDNNIPALDGWTTSRIIKKIRPATKICLILPETDNNSKQNISARIRQIGVYSCLFKSISAHETDKLMFALKEDKPDQSGQQEQILANVSAQEASAS